MDKQRLQELAGITPTSQKLASLISSSIASIDPNMSYKDLAGAVAIVLKNEYGTHNYEKFIGTLKSNLEE